MSPSSAWKDLECGSCLAGTSFSKTGIDCGLHFQQNPSLDDIDGVPCTASDGKHSSESKFDVLCHHIQLTADTESEPPIASFRNEFGNELASDARVWPIYVEEASEYDKIMIDGLDGSLDVLLIFTGLFSAVVTAFVLQSYSMLQPDTQQYSLKLLADISTVLHFQATGDGGPTLPTSPLPLGFDKPSDRAIRVNCLWFASLSISLVTSVIVMLAKQWLHQYGVGLSSAAHIQTALRQSRFDSLVEWKLPLIISLLPTVLHLALALFFVGLIDFLWDSSFIVAVIPALIFALTGAIYLITMILPFYRPTCPFKTPVSQIVNSSLLKLSYSWNYHKWQIPRPTQCHSSTQDIQALAWLVKTSRKPWVVDTALQALAGLPRDGAEISMTRTISLINAVRARLISCFQRTGPMSHEISLPVGMQEDAARFTRAWVALVRHARSVSNLRSIDYNEVIIMFEVLGRNPNPDIATAGLAAGALAAGMFPIHIRRLPGRLADISNLLFRSAEEHLLSPLAYLLLVDVLGECAAALNGDDLMATTMVTLPALLKLLPMSQSSPPDQLYSSIAVALPILTLGYKHDHVSQLRSEEQRRDVADELFISSLVPIVLDPPRFGLEHPGLIEIATLQLVRSFFSYYLSSAERRMFIARTGALRAFLAALEYSDSEHVQSETLSAISLIPASYLPLHAAAVVFSVLQSSKSEEVILRGTLTISSLAEEIMHIPQIIENNGIDLLIQNLTSESREIARTSSYALCSVIRSMAEAQIRVEDTKATHSRLFGSLCDYSSAHTSNWHDLRRWMECFTSFSDSYHSDDGWKKVVQAFVNASEKLGDRQLHRHEEEDRHLALAHLEELQRSRTKERTPHAEN